MRYLFLSDLHLGDGSVSDDFGDNDGKFFRWLDKVIEKKGIDKVVYIGDVYECWQFGMKAIRKAHEMLCEYLDHCTVLKGNHDYKLTGAKTKRIPLSDGYVHVSHGCWNDRNMSNPIIRAGVWLYGMTIEKLFPDSDKCLAKNNSKDGIYKMTFEYAETALKDRDCRIVICGHTHKAEVIGTSYGMYANTGTCQDGKFTGIILDTQAENVSIVRS